jgi:hypothetical protein
MRKLLTAAAMALLFPLAADAQFGLGASLGVSIPMGEAQKDVDLSDTVAAEIPIEINARYTVIPKLDLGVYGGYAFGIVGGDAKDTCDDFDLDCSVRTWRLGLFGEYAFDAGGMLPFVGASFGWEWGSIKFEEGSYWEKYGSSGWEFGLKGGVDWKLGEKAKVGAFIGLAFGTYGKYTYEDSDDNEDDGDIEDTAMHEWLTIGVRGTFGL